ncbi:MAG: hypothetical protein JXA07_03850 [Spirochaetes bacterium]|nr:hypothetical protein [Spirochaetota bacterium]
MIRFAGGIGKAMFVVVLCVVGSSESYGRLYKIASINGNGEQAGPQAESQQEPEIVKEFYPSGKVKAETPFLNGRIHGVKKIFFENGVLQKEEEYRDGMREGISREYYEDGVLKSYETFKDDRLNGESYMNYPGGQRIMSGQCADGKKSGKWTLFHNNGNKYMEGNYENGVMEGQWRSFSPEGWLDSEGEYKNGLQSGLWIYYDKSRRIAKKLTLKDGMIDGMCWIYKEGKLVGEGTMTGQSHNPVRHGNWKTYFIKNGRLKYEGVFVMGKKNGQFREYYPTSNIKAFGEYNNDKRNGNWVFYDEDGKTINEAKSGLYTMGKLFKKTPLP